MMDWLWLQIEQSWSNAFLNKNSPLNCDWRKETEWQNQMRRLSIYQVVQGIEAVKKMEKYNDFAPNAHAFANIASELPLAKDMPTKEEIYHNVQMMRSLRKKEQLPEAVWIVRKSGASWETMTYLNSAGRREFERCYQALTAHILAGGVVEIEPERALIEPEIEAYDIQPDPDIPLDGDEFFTALLKKLEAV